MGRFSVFRELSVAAAAFLAVSAQAAEFRAELDRNEIAQDESVSMKLIVEADGTVPIETPEFSAPSFEEIQNYQGSFVQSYYDSASGKFGAKFTRSFTYVLRPKSVGKLTIENIRIKVDGQPLTAPSLSVTVSGGGAGTPPPKGYGGAGSGLRGAAKKNRGTMLFLRTEVDKTKAYKGQQVVVNYYLYSRTPNFNATADRYPTLSGFLKEELDVPVLTGRLNAQNVVLDGTAYRRVLIASFAAYPLKEGKLIIDPMEVKATYITERSGSVDAFDMDDEDLFQRFFQAGSPRTETLRSESITVEVSSLPPVPKDLNYTGAVGDFEVIAAVDRTDLKAHEALTLSLKIEGSGNISNIETPKIGLPDGFELYETKTQTRGKAGIGEKVFEYLIIPRRPGDYTLPRIELGFFDPKSGQFVRKSTDPISIHVNEGVPGAESQPPVQGGTDSAVASPERESKRIFSLTGDSEPMGERLRSLKGPWKVGLLLLLAVVALGALLFRFRESLGAVVGGVLAKSRKQSAKEREWAKLRRRAEESERLPFHEVLKGFDFLESELEDALSERYGVAVRGMTRAELKETLVERAQIPEDRWQRIARLLEYTETVRFASQAGAVSEESARSELRKWIAELEQILASLPPSSQKSGL